MAARALSRERRDRSLRTRPQAEQDVNSRRLFFLVPSGEFINCSSVEIGRFPEQ